jgi:formaldehyde-activating enzyme involved in methanogenesis
MSKIIFKAGEATVYTEGKDVTAAMPEILIGSVDGPVGAAFANMMAQSKGHTAMFAVRNINQLVRPTCMISLVWIDPGAAKEANLDKADMYKNNYDATKLAIKRALNDEPSIDELIKNRHKIKHCMWEDSWEQK